MQLSRKLKDIGGIESEENFSFTIGSHIGICHDWL